MGFKKVFSNRVVQTMGAAIIISLLLIVYIFRSGVIVVEGMTELNQPKPGIPTGGTSVGGPGTELSSEDIPPGSADLYVLKSSIPAPTSCPAPPACPRAQAAPPCPACERCPEPSFECKKVPNYQAGMGNVPSPVLTDFSSIVR